MCGIIWGGQLRFADCGRAGTHLLVRGAGRRLVSVTHDGAKRYGAEPMETTGVVSMATKTEMKVTKSGNDILITLVGAANILTATDGRKRTKKTVPLVYSATDVVGIAADRGDKKIVSPFVAVNVYIPKKRLSEQLWNSIPEKGTEDEQTSEFAAE